MSKQIINCGKITVQYKSSLPKLIKNWKWKSADGRRTKPVDMDTHHLYNTLVLIWNSTVPDAAMKVGSGKAVTFNYSDKYLAKAVQQIGRELLVRWDKLDTLQQINLEKMAAYFNKPLLPETPYVDPHVAEPDAPDDFDYAFMDD